MPPFALGKLNSFSCFDFSRSGQRYLPSCRRFSIPKRLSPTARTPLHSLGLSRVVRIYTTRYTYSGTFILEKQQGHSDWLCVSLILFVLSAPPGFKVKTPGNFCWWLLTHLSPLYWFNEKGVYSQRKKVKRNLRPFAVKRSRHPSSCDVAWQADRVWNVVLLPTYVCLFPSGQAWGRMQTG